MSLYGMMRTSVSGMNSQANKLTSISDNISNSDTIGYKKAENQFLSLVQDNGADSFAAGGVISQVRYGISEQGTLSSTSSATDLAINGNGFFVVSDKNGQNYLTRAGSFVPDASGNMVNAAGFYLMAYSTKNGAPNVVANGLQGMEIVKADATQLSAAPSTAGTFSANLPSTATAVAAADLPSANAASAQYTDKTSLIAYDNLGAPTTLDVYMTKKSDSTWEMSVYSKSAASPSGGFPYSSPALATNTLTFDSTTGKLDSSSPSSVVVPVANGSSVDLDISSMTQLAAGYSVSSATLNGNAPSTLNHVEIGGDGNVSSIFSDGTRTTTYKIPLVNVASPDSLTPESGNVYSLSRTSGDPLVGFAGTSGLGEIKSSSLEQSTVDLATELTNMIEAQRGYTANSKVFQTGAELLDVLVNLKN